LKLIHKIEVGQTPGYLKKYMKKRKEFHNHNLRRKSEFNRPQFRKRIAQNSLIYKGIEIYNEFRKEAGRTNNEKELFRKLMANFSLRLVLI
jgi:hypothetical protein